MAEIEKRIIESNDIHRLSHLPDFPYSSLDELKRAYDAKEIVFGIEYNGEFMEVIGTKLEYILQMFWVSLPIIIVVADIVIAIFLKEWILLLGILFALIGFISSSPYNPLKNIVSGLGGVLFVASFFLFDWTWSVIIGSMLFSQIFTLTAREQYRMVVEERVLHSEVFFVYLFQTKQLFVKNLITGKYL